MSDVLSGLRDGIDGVQRGFSENENIYFKHYHLGRRIVGGAKGITAKEMNCIKICGGFILTDDERDRLKRLVLNVYNQHGDFEAEFSLCEMDGAKSFC